jgi:TPR repeat protein
LAAEQVHAGAQFNLGVKYDKGEGVPEDNAKAKAVKWYRLAAEQGHVGAQHKLGFMYAMGEGVPKDYVQAYAWWNLAAAQGDKIASKAKGILRKRMTRKQIAKAQALSAQMCKTILGCAK